MSTLSNAARNVIDGAIDLAGAAFGGGNNSLGKVAVASGALALTGMTTAQGGLIDSLANDPQYRAAAGQQLLGGSLANQYGGAAVGLRTYLNGVQQNLTSTVLSNRYVLAPLHGVTRVLDTNSATGIASGCSLEISTGANAQTDRGLVRQVSRIITFAGAAANDPTRPDYCVLELTDLLPNVTEIQIAAPVTGALAYVTGFGSVAQPGGNPVRDYWARGGTAPIGTASDLVSYNAEYYLPMKFNPAIYPSLNWKGLNGDSGSPWVIPGQGVIAMSVAASNGTFTTGLTDSLILSNSEIYGNIEQYTHNVPSPGAIGLSLVATSVLAARRRR